MQRTLSGRVGALVFGLSLTAVPWASAQQPVAMKIPAPELKGIDEWINSKPTSLKDLRGKVVVLHFWAFGWINCIRNYPWYTGWHEDFAEKGLVVLGVHTPETEQEKKIEKVRQKVKDNGMKYPIAVDGAGKTWQAWDNRWWPSVYLIDKQGNVRYRWDGELNWKETKGEEIMRKKIEELLAEKE
jgi:peroxiredoxin